MANKKFFKSVENPKKKAKAFLFSILFVLSSCVAAYAASNPDFAKGALTEAREAKTSLLENCAKVDSALEAAALRAKKLSQDRTNKEKVKNYLKNKDNDSRNNSQTEASASADSENFFEKILNKIVSIFTEAGAGKNKALASNSNNSKLKNEKKDKALASNSKLIRGKLNLDIGFDLNKIFLGLPSQGSFEIVNNGNNKNTRKSHSHSIVKSSLTAKEASIAGSLSADSLSTKFLSANSGRFNVLSVTKNLNLPKNLRVSGLIYAAGGINTKGADIDLGGGKIKASNVVYSIQAGENIKISGPANRPVISASDNAKRTIMGSGGGIAYVGGNGIAYTGGDDVSIEEDSAVVNNTSDLKSVVSRGGCTDCLKDNYISNSLTIDNGKIDSIPIGTSTSTIAKFTTATTTNFRVTNNVGIGTTSPSEKLDVAGFINTDKFSGYKQDGNTMLVSTTTAHLLAVGVNALDNNLGAYSTSTADTSGTYNTAIGENTLEYATSTDYNTAVGYEALQMSSSDTADNSGYENTAIGYQSLYSNTTGSYNTANGYEALYSNTTGYHNAAMGYEALYSNTEGIHNSAVGYQALYNNTTSYSNSAVGYEALYYNTTGDRNSAMGYRALFNNTTGNRNSAMGMYALYNNTEDYNSAMGYHALYSNTTGNYNSAMGGEGLYSNTTGNHNSAMGYYALYNNTTGNGNSAMGRDAGRYQADGSTDLETAEHSIYIGAYTKGYDNNDNNSIVIGYDAIGAGPNTVVLGNDSITTTALKGSIGIGTTSPTEKLNVLSDTASTTLISNSANLEHIFNDSSGLEDIGSGMLFSAEADDDSIVNIGQVASVFNNASSTAPHTDLRFYTRNEGDLTERARIDKEGNVGIGTTSPSYTIDINGTLRATDNTFFDANLTIGNEAADSVSVNSDDWTFKNDTNFVLDGGVNGLSFNTDTLSIDASNGNVGIGTTTPSEKLNVLSDTASTTLISNLINSEHVFNDSSGLEGIGSGMLFSAEADDDSIVNIGQVASVFNNASSTAPHTDLRFYTRNEGDLAERARIDKEGNVGIGTTSPTEKLTLAGHSNFLQKSGDPAHMGAIDDDANTELDGAWTIHVSGKYAYVVGDDDDGVEVLDISDPTNPTHVGAITDDADTALDGANSIYVSGKYAYVASASDDGVEVLDISDPTNPTHVGAIDDNSTTALDGAYSIYVSGKYAYVAGYIDDGVEVLDISDPTDPTHVGAITDDADTALDKANSIYVSGKYAYVAAYADDGVEVLDISDPTNPTHVGAITDDADTELDGTHSIYVSGKYAYVAAAADDGVEVLDISDPTDPTHVGAIDDNSTTELDGAFSIYVSGKYAYVVGDDDDGVEVLDISDPTNPTHVGAITDDADTELDGARSIYVSGKYAYVGARDDDGVEVLDIPGLDVPSAHIGDVAAGTLDVWENAVVENNLYAQGGLNVGPGGILTNGLISVSGSGDNYFAGNIGIGTTTPSEKLNILSDTASTTLISNPANLEHTFNDSSGLEDIGSGMLFSAEADDDSIVNIGQVASVFNNASSTAPHTDLRFYTRNEGDLTERARITKEGNVGIGTTSPDVLLHIGDNVLTNSLANESLMVSGDLEVDGTTYLEGKTNLSNASTTQLTVSDELWIGDEDTDTLNIRAGDWNLTSTATTTAAMTNGLNFDSDTFVIAPNSDRVGILTSAPSYGLDINGTLRTTDNTFFDANLTIGDEDADSVSVNSDDWTFANDTNFVLSGGVNGLSFDTDTLSIDASNGNVGIGTTSPNTKLHVAATTTIGSASTDTQAGVQIGFGGLCADDDGTCSASTTGELLSASLSLLLPSVSLSSLVYSLVSLDTSPTITSRVLVAWLPEVSTAV